MGDRDNAALDDIELPAGTYINCQEYLPGLYLDEGYTELGQIRFNNDRGETADSKSHWAQYEKSRWPTQPRLQSELAEPRPRPGQVRQRNCPQSARPAPQPARQSRPAPAPALRRRTREGFVGIRELYGDRSEIEAVRAVGEGVPAGYSPDSGPDWARLLPGQSACVVPEACAGGYPMREDWPVSSKARAKNEPWNSGPPTGDCSHGGHSKSGFSSTAVDGGQLMQMLQTLLLFILVILMAVKLGFSIARHSPPAGPIMASRYDAVK